MSVKCLAQRCITGLEINPLQKTKTSTNCMKLKTEHYDP